MKKAVSLGPYRTGNSEKVSLERRIIMFRFNALPGPVRRILGLLFAVPIFVSSFLLALFLVAPLSWIMYGNSVKYLDIQQRGYRGNKDYYHQSNKKLAIYEYVPLIRGTLPLFVSKNDLSFYEDVELGNIIHYREY